MSLEPAASDIKTSVAEPVNQYTSCHCCDVITTLVVPILWAVSVSLIIYYTVHPITPLIPIYGDFSISLPLLICSSTGLTLTLLLIVQIARRGKIKIACGQCLGNQVYTSPMLQQNVRKILHPGGRPEGQTVAAYRQERAGWIEQVTEVVGSEVTFSTRDKVKLRGYWHFLGKHIPTIIFFYGNQMTADEAFFCSEFYDNYNVLLVDFRGYGISEGIAAGTHAELEAYFDAEAALAFVRSQNVDPTKIIAHGFSLGGGYAAALGYFFDVPYIILHNTFTSSTAVASHVSTIGPEMITPAFLASYTQGSAPKLPLIGTKDLQTDGFNTLSKIQNMNSHVFVIQSDDDHLMPIEFGAQLVQARYPDKTDQENHLITLPGGHDLESFFGNNTANSVDKFIAFLRTHHLLD